MEVKDKIEVGEYIKLKRGDIFKIDEDTTNYYNSNKEFITNEIAKHSKNIIDLIEVGDIVTYWLGVGYYTTRTVDVDFLKQIKDTFTNEDIRSIVTKEQFAEMEYRV